MMPIPTPNAMPYGIHSAVGLARALPRRKSIHSANHIHSANPLRFTSPSRTASTRCRTGMANPPSRGGEGTLGLALGDALGLLSRWGFGGLGLGDLVLGHLGDFGQSDVCRFEGSVPVVPDAQPLDAGLAGLGVDDELADFVGIRDGGLAIENLGVLTPLGDCQRLGLVHPQCAIVRSGLVLVLSHFVPCFLPSRANGRGVRPNPKVILPLSRLLGFTDLKGCHPKTFQICKVPPNFIKVPSSQRAPRFLHDALFDPYLDIEVIKEQWLVIETWDRIVELLIDEWRWAFDVVVSEGGVI